MGADRRRDAPDAAGGRAPRRGRSSRRWPRPRGWRCGYAEAGPSGGRASDEQAVLLAGVARPARRHHVVPGVRTATGPRHDVVDVLGRPVAVLAAVAVAGEHGPARQRDAVAVRHPHEVNEADHRRHRDVGALGAELGAVARDDLGLLLQHEHDRPAHRHDAQRLEAGVEQQRSSQASGPPHRNGRT